MNRPREISRAISVFPTKTPTLPPATTTNSYALGSQDVLLIEPATPYEDEQRAFLEWARALPSDGRRAIAIVPTHHHPDHVGGIDVLARELALPIWAHEQTATRIDMPVSRRLSDGETISLDGPVPTSWRVLHTPGHAPGHVCLFEEGSRALVVGDMVASEGTILIAPGDGDMRVYLEQLGRLADLNARVALPAHGEPIDSPNDVFRRYVSHRLARELKIDCVVKAAGAEGISIGDIVPRAYDDASPALWPIASLSVASHLEKLEGEGRVVHRGDLFVSSDAREGAPS